LGAFGVIGVEQGVGRLPEIFQHVNDIQDNDHRRSILCRRLLDVVDLGGITIHQGHPFGLVRGSRRTPSSKPASMTAFMVFPDWPTAAWPPVWERQSGVGNQP